MYGGVMATLMATTSDRRAMIAPVSDARSYWIGVVIGLFAGLALGMVVTLIVLAMELT
jgi:hypothetical protein